MEKYGPFFQPGSAFVLKNVMVIATEWNSYMIVTLNNLVKLYKVIGRAGGKATQLQGDTGGRENGFVYIK